MERPVRKAAGKEIKQGSSPGRPDDEPYLFECLIEL